MIDDSIPASAPLPLRRQGVVQRPFPFKNLPFALVMGYLGLTLALFLIWPINWPIYTKADWASLIGYMLLSFGAIAMSFRFGVGRPVNGSANLSVTGLIALGAIAAVAILIPSSYLYTGRWPWEVFSALRDQGEAYRSLQYQLTETTGQRGPVAFVRAVAAPLTFAVIPLGILYWRQLTGVFKLFVVATALASMIFSVLRGTDREFADLFIVGASAFLISIARGGATQSLVLIKRYWKAALILLIFVSLAASLFTDRKSARLGGYEDRISVCANDSTICADVDAPLVKWMPVSQRFAISLFILSTCSGYYGLQLAREKDFESTYGMGHSPAMISIYALVTGDKDLVKRTYTYRNGIDGWSEENYWSSLITWLANDVGFGGAIFALAFLGYLWGKTWRDAVQGRNDAAAILFCLSMLILFYLPANNQVFASYDGYFIFFTWLIVWIMRRGGPNGAL